VAEAPPASPRTCPQCGAELAGPGTVEGLCAACLLGLGLSGSGEGDSADDLSESWSDEHERDTRARAGPGPIPSRSSRDDARLDPAARRGLREAPRIHPLGIGMVAPLGAMPAELLRQAARRLRDAGLGLGAAFALSIVLNNLLESAGWYSFAHPGLKNVVAAGMITLSLCVAGMAHSRPLTPRLLLRLGLAYEVGVALAISLGDHLEPMPADVPFASVSWVCVWIVIFPLVVPAPPLWTFLASFGAASMWPLAHLVRILDGDSLGPGRLLFLNATEAYVAAALALVTALVVRRMQEVGFYRLEEKLDHGGMGEIWRARHHLLARSVAVKLIRPELLGVKSPGEAAELVDRFRREAEATAALHSSHTVGLHDFGMTPEGVFYYVMELLDGLDLDTLVRRFGPVPPERAIHLLEQACESLAEAHAAGLVHRDVKPANLVTCRSGLKYDFVKVLDFGLVKTTWGLGEDEHVTSDGRLAGTPAYIAPEVALGGRPLDARVDLYGLGCVAYWLLTGEKVFTGASPMEVVLNHVKATPIPPSERAGHALPEDLERLVLSCLAKEPKDRPPSAQWLGARLAECRTEGRWTPDRAREWWEQHLAPGLATSTASGRPRDTKTEPGTPG
jgi:serine/threonine protein kinase